MMRKKQVKKFTVLVMSDDYNSLYKDNKQLKDFYEPIMNSCFDDYYFELSITNKIIFNDTDKYDFVVFDYGLIGQLDVQGIRKLYKIKNLFVTSAMPANYIRGEDCYLPYVNFEFEYMGLELRNHIKSLCPKCNKSCEYVRRTEVEPRKDIYKCEFHGEFKKPM
jgi:hypothetical protein